MDRIKAKLRHTLYIKNLLVRQFLAEFLGTFILVVSGDGTCAQNKLSGGSHGDHTNPAISVLMAVLGRIDWKKLLVYMMAQYLGAFVGAAAVYLTYLDAINNFEGAHGVRTVDSVNSTAGNFATYPNHYITTAEAFWDQLFGTLLLAMSVLAITDSRNMDVHLGVAPLALGGTVLAIGLAYGFNCGFAINPARDFSPRLFTFAVGYGREVFWAHNYYFWIPIVAPHIGGLVGGFIYFLFIGLHLEMDEEIEKEQHIVFIPDRNWTARPSIFLPRNSIADREQGGHDLPERNWMARPSRKSIKNADSDTDTAF